MYARCCAVLLLASTVAVSVLIICPSSFAAAGKPEFFVQLGHSSTVMSHLVLGQQNGYV